MALFWHDPSDVSLCWKTTCWQKGAPKVLIPKIGVFKCSMLQFSATHLTVNLTTITRNNKQPWKVVNLCTSGHLRPIFSGVDEGWYNPHKNVWLPSGKRFHNYGKSPFWWVKQLFLWPFSNVNLPEGTRHHGLYPNTGYPKISRTAWTEDAFHHFKGRTP